MDYKKLLERTWHIMWNYRALWIFGLILAMTVGGTTNLSSYHGNTQRNNTSPAQGTNFIPWDSQAFKDPQSFFQSLEKAGNQLTHIPLDRKEINAVIGFLIAFFLIAILISVGMTFLRYVSETAVIQMVDHYESNGEKLTWKQGFKVGWSRPAWRLFLIDLLIGVVPGLIFFLFLVLSTLGTVVFVVKNPSPSTQIVTIAVAAGIIFLVLIFFVLFFIVMDLVRNLIGRVCVIEDKGVGESIRRGISLAWKNWKQVGLFWLIMIGLGIMWWIISILAAIILIPVLVITVIVGALLGSVPGIIAGLISSIFITGYWPVVIGIIFGLPLFIYFAFLPIFFVQSFAQIFRFTSWTLVFRELQSMAADGELKELVSP